MKAIDKTSTKILHHLISLTDNDKHLKLDNASPSFMAFNLECIWEGKAGIQWALSHYYLHHSGDMIPDPDMVVLQVNDEFFPIQYQDMYRFDEAVTWKDGEIESVDEAMQSSLAEFVNMWLRNIVEQQRVEIEGVDLKEESEG